MLSLLRARIQFLVGELRSHELPCVAKKKRKRKKERDCHRALEREIKIAE